MQVFMVVGSDGIQDPWGHHMIIRMILLASDLEVCGRHEEASVSGKKRSTNITC
jgi:hypothetical protein